MALALVHCALGGGDGIRAQCLFWADLELARLFSNVPLKVPVYGLELNRPAHYHFALE